MLILAYIDILNSLGSCPTKNEYQIQTKYNKEICMYLNKFIFCSHTYLFVLHTMQRIA